MSKKILVTGGAGFIGYHLTKKLVGLGYTVVGVDNLNDYYDVSLKMDRLKELEVLETYTFEKLDISNKELLDVLFEKHDFNYVINLAAQAGVRYSIENPDVYIQSNIVGFHNIAEMARKYKIEHLLYASSSSVYGNSDKVPFSETDNVDHPISLYAATKKSNELEAATYSHLYKIPSTGLRFFTVYGPFGRPDMAYFGFVNAYYRDDIISIYNNHNFENDLLRDFTYIDDIVEGIVRLIDVKPEADIDYHRVVNIGNNEPVKLMAFIDTLEKSMSKATDTDFEFKKEFVDYKPGDVKATFADTSVIEKLVDFKPSTSLADGLDRFAQWYVEYYKKGGK